MKKIISALLLVVVVSTSCFSQNNTPSYNNGRDFFSIKKYLQDNLDSLDPIEGIYNVQIDRTYERIETAMNGNKFYNNYSDNYTNRFAIVRSEDNRFEVISDNKNNEMQPFPERILITRIGETMAYSIKMDYKYNISYENPEKETVASRIVLESLLNFHFIVKYHFHYVLWNVHDENYSDEYDFIKEYPTTSMYEEAIKSQPSEWTGTGFAIGNSYIVTNNHVAGEAKTISVKGVKGDMNTGYTAEVVATDKINDIAILRISDSQFTGFGSIPYAVQQRMADVGEDIFVLGYPLTQALGNEIKLTNGIVSSRTGYQGNIATYQMSAPVQPGNSGGPMFDNKGNIIGIVVAGVPGAENVGYAIKTSYLNILIESAGLNIKLPANNTISTLSLAEKVKRVKNFVFYIECSK